jgi:G3E family GTPase
MIPTNIITGFLGVGKTTAILNLLRHRVRGERWGVLVNEFGDVAIDQIPLACEDNGNVMVREVAGGCICCSAGVPVQDAVKQMLHTANIDRLVIEPTGLGHPWRVLDALRDKQFQDILDLRATICLVDSRQARKAVAENNRTFLDQAHLADVIVANKIDLADEQAVADCLDWAKSLFPAKSLIGAIQHGHLEPAWLDIPSDPLRTPLFAELHSHHHHHHAAEHAVAETPLLAQGRPHRAVSVAQDHYACGWIFSPADVFDEDRLLEILFDHLDVARLKGVFRIGDEWIYVNRVQEESKMEFTAYRRDSRLEIIADNPCNWLAFEQSLISCLK